MKTLTLLTLTAFALSGVAFTSPASAAVDAKTFLQGSTAVPAISTTATEQYQLARRGSDDRGGDDSGRGRGRGGDDRGDDDRGGARGGGSNDDESGSGRRKPRIPGGSGCDDAGDIAEHPECRG